MSVHPTRRLPAFYAAGLLLAAGLLGGCKSNWKASAYLGHFELNSSPAIEAFEVCDSAGCKSKSNLAFSIEEWARIAAVFEPPAQSPIEERERINQAVGLFEKIVGNKNQTLGDAPMNRRKLGTGKQLDCLAEAANTTVALILFENAGLLRHHRVGYPAHRGFVQLRLPHNTATIYELESGAHYAVDSWFHAGGKPSVSVPVGEWKAGYSPFDSADR